MRHPESSTQLLLQLLISTLCSGHLAPPGPGPTFKRSRPTSCCPPLCAYILSIFITMSLSLSLYFVSNHNHRPLFFYFHYQLSTLSSYKFSKQLGKSLLKRASYLDHIIIYLYLDIFEGFFKSKWQVQCIFNFFLK